MSGQCLPLGKPNASEAHAKGFEHGAHPKEMELVLEESVCACIYHMRLSLIFSETTVGSVSKLYKFHEWGCC